jgi:uncharacterized membrane protein YbaN (DUF454 family)
MKRIPLIILGIASTTFAVIGVFVPGMPTTIFVIIALWAFTRSSSRLTNWVRSLSILKSAVNQADNFFIRRAVTKKVKIIAQLFAWCSAILILISGALLLVKMLVVASALACSFAMLKLRTIK